MAKIQLTYTEKGKKPRTEIFRCMGDARDFLSKLEKSLNIISAELKEIEKKESALGYLGRAGRQDAT